MYAVLAQSFIQSIHVCPAAAGHSKLVIRWPCHVSYCLTLLKSRSKSTLLMPCVHTGAAFAAQSRRSDESVRSKPVLRLAKLQHAHPLRLHC